ncbi:hypothetical protein [Prevotellamassilia timonensis]|uniref:hypothetical protein n=1 Tax=Prevotellamassilia timonensis TaxID=1852370 RepID=UPI003A905733
MFCLAPCALSEGRAHGAKQNISDNCLCRVSHEIARSKAPATAPDGSAPAPMQPASAAPTTTPKRTRKPAAKRTTRKKANATA